MAVPASTPLTVAGDDEPVTVAILPLAGLQVPPVTASLSEVLAPAHMLAEPVMVPATGNGFTVTTLVATAVPQLLDTE